MATTPTLELCDDLVTALVTAWGPSDPSGAERHYFKRFADQVGAQDLAESLRLVPDERRVVIFPTRYSSGYAAKAEDRYTHEIAVLVAERYPDAGDPPRDWIDARVDWVYEYVVRGFDFRAPPAWNRYLRTLSQEIEICDIDRLVEQKLFWSAVAIVFEELRSV